MQGLVSCVIHPLLLGNTRRSYRGRILGHLYFLLFLKVQQLRRNAKYITTYSCSSIWNSSRRRYALADDAIEVTSELDTSRYTVSVRKPQLHNTQKE